MTAVRRPRHPDPTWATPAWKLPGVRFVPRTAEPSTPAAHVSPRFPRLVPAADGPCMACNRPIHGAAWLFRDGRAMCREHGFYGGPP